MTEAPAVSFEQVYARILERRSADPAQSYVARLSRQGEDAILQKVGEEGIELVIAAKNRHREPALREPALHELADLWFHMMVWMAEAGYTLDDLRCELGRRYAPQAAKPQ